MPEDDKGGGWSKLLDRLQRPSDWVAAGVGALGGAAVSISVSGLDLGTSIATGAIAGVTAKASGEATLERWGLRRKAARLSRRIARSTQNNKTSDLAVIANKLNIQTQLWEDKLVENGKFSEFLDELVAQYSEIILRNNNP